MKNSKSVFLFRQFLEEKEKSIATIQKYTLEVNRLMDYLGERDIDKELLIAYRKTLCMKYQARTVNGKINAINAYLKFLKKDACVLNLLRVQRQSFISDDRELSEEDYKKLIRTAKAKGKTRLYMLMLTLALTGLRVSELQFITVESIQKGIVEIHMKGKFRSVLLVGALRKKLLKYIKEKNIVEGIIFKTKAGNPVDRSNINHDMKSICTEAQVDPHRVFPHNFRHLFARSFFSIEKNIAHLADVLGHSSIETTRIYLMSTAKDYTKTMNRMSLIM